MCTWFVSYTNLSDSMVSWHPFRNRQISDDTIEKLRGIFLSLDEDNSGTLSAPVAAGFRKWIQASFWAFLLDPVRTIQGGQLGNAQENGGKESRTGWMELGGACRISWRLCGFWVASGIYRDPHLGSCCLQRASPKTCPWPNLELGPTPLNGPILRRARLGVHEAFMGFLFWGIRCLSRVTRSWGFGLLAWGFAPLFGMGSHFA